MGLSPKAPRRSAWWRAGASAEAFSEPGLGAGWGAGACGSPPLSDERLPCSQQRAHPSSPGASGLQATQQQHEPRQGDRGPLSGEPRREGRGGGEL